jgi:IS30 family transposase
LGRSVSTISREVKRNQCVHDGFYRAEKAHSRAMVRRSASRKKSQYSQEEWRSIEALIKRKWSPKQIAGRRLLKRQRPISHETIYRRVRRQRSAGGDLWRHMRVMSKVGRKHKGSPATRGKLLGKRHVSERPAAVARRRQIGHFEGDTVMGPDGRYCILTLVERATRTKEQASTALARAIIGLGGRVRTITLDNGTEFHGYKEVENQLGVKFYFATPYRSWERGTNENTNGLVRQYLPKGQCLKWLTQTECNRIAKELNDRPRERLGFKTPAEAYRPS